MTFNLSGSGTSDKSAPSVNVTMLSYTETSTSLSTKEIVIIVSIVLAAGVPETWLMLIGSNIFLFFGVLWSTAC